MTRSPMDGGDMASTGLEGSIVGEVGEWIRTNESRIVAVAQALVRCESETRPPHGNEGPVQELIATELRSLGLEVDTFEPWHVDGVTEHPGWWPGLDYTDRPNVVGTLKGASHGPSLILNGHADVVSAGDHAAWTFPPYDAELHRGNLYGRGAVDMKGGLAASLSAIRCLRELGLAPAGDVIVESVVNEELGGYNGTLACIAKGYAADAAVITEPTDFQVGIATKGGQVYSARVPGVPAHSSWWWKGISALDKAIEFKAALKRWEEARAEETRSNPYFADPSFHPQAAYADTVWSLRAGDPEIMAHPAEAELHFWVDHLPGEDREELLQRFEQYVGDFCAGDEFLASHPIVLERGVMRPFTGVGIDPDHNIVDSLRRVHRAVRGREAAVTGFPAATDSMMFNLYSSTPAVIFGGGDAIEGNAHAPDEHISVKDLSDTANAVALLVLDHCGFVRGERLAQAGSEAKNVP
jgi:acetylornithine deacetylase